MTTLATQNNTAIVQRLIDALWNGADERATHEIVAPGYVGHFVSHPQPVQGPTGLLQFAGGYRAAFPDLLFTADDVVAAGDRVVVRWTATGTNTGSLMGMPPTGKRGSSTGIWIHRLEDGKLVEQWGVSDVLGLLQQLGALPTPSPAA